MRHDSTLPINPNLNIDFSEVDLKEIYLAGGCFWGVEAYMARIPGVSETTVGYANGTTEDPTYEAVCRGNTGHAETVHIRYDPEKLLLADLLREFFQIIDPTVRNRQGNDIGSQYRTAIFYVDPVDAESIRTVISEEQKKYDRPIVTEVEPLRRYTLAEDYHQKYLEKNPHGYCHISFETLPQPDIKTAEAAGADSGTAANNGADVCRDYPKPDDEELRNKLSQESYDVTQRNATEPPFSGRYWASDDEGLYVDIVTGEPLFTSMDKFQSACGWPSFSKPVDPEVIKEKPDHSHGRIRTEVRSHAGDSHLGHVFTDGPRDRGGLRYCINSVALRFIPKAELEAEGYGEYLKLFKANEKEDD